MIQLYTGDGKGKTTAAIGAAVRAAGRGWDVAFAQFMKGNDTGELYSLRQIPHIRILRSGKNFGFYSAMSETQKRELTDIHDQILEELLALAEARTCRMIVLDEITYPVKWGLLEEEKLRRLLRYGAGGDTDDGGGDTDDGGGDALEIVLTGRDAADSLRLAADYITCMEAVRHPFEKGIAAREGIEY